MFLKPSLSTRTFVLSLLKWGKVINCGLTVNRRMIIGHLIERVQFLESPPSFKSNVF